MWCTKSNGTLDRGIWWLIGAGFHLIREQLGTNGLNDGAVGANGEVSLGEPSHGEGRRDRLQTSQVQPSGIEETAVVLFAIQIEET
jgi:hypothetical protein